MIPPIDDDEIRFQALRETLLDLPTTSKRTTKREMVRRLAHTINEARRKGHSLRAITDHLQKNGSDISYSTLRYCLAPTPRTSKDRSGPKERAAVKKRPVATVASTETPPSLATTRETAPPASSKKPTPKPSVPEKRVFPPGASFIPIGNGQFLPAPDSDDL